MIEQLKIAMISFHSCPLGNLGGRDTGGMNVYIRELAQELGRRGHIVDIYTRAHQPEHGQIINMGTNVRLIHLETGCGEEIPKIAFYSYVQRFICGAENFRNSADLHYDLLHSHYWLSGLAGKHLHLWWHIPHVIMFHTLGAVKNSIGIGEEETDLRIESEREVVTACERIIAATSKEKEDLIQYYGAFPRNISIIPCGVNLDLFKPVDKGTARNELGLDHQKIILFVGRLEPLKGLEQLLKALSQTADEATPRLIIIGGDEHSQTEVQALQNMAVELHVQDKVSFFGSVIQNRLPLLYSAADICVIPSYYESFGMVALESLACGTPVVATNVGDMRNIIRHDDAGYVLEDNSPHDLAEKIFDILYRRENRAKDIKTRRSLMTEYNWSKIADRILREYECVLREYSAVVSP